MTLIKSVLRKNIIRILKIAGSVLLFILVYLAAAFLMPSWHLHKSFTSAKKGVEIYILSNGVHTDFVLPVKSGVFNWDSMIPYSDVEKADSTYNYVSMGWGDKGFYIDTPTWEDLKASTAFKAAFGLGSTAMHISFRKAAPRPGELCKKLILSEKQYQLLVKYIQSSFRMKDGKPELIKHPGYSEQDCFYEANGSYSMFRTCNVWTGNGLRTIGNRIGSWTPFHRGVLDECSEDH